MRHGLNVQLLVDTTARKALLSMRITSFQEPCLCGSGQTYLECCLKNCRPVPDPNRTGVSHQACYASGFNDCSTKITGEHYISEGVLKQFGPKVGVGGLPWIEEGQTKILPTGVLTANILCDRHNSMLSPIDQVGIRFFRELGPGGGRVRFGPDDPPEFHVFRGEMVELWMLKVACGLIASRNAADRDTGLLIEESVPTAWIHILFGLAPMPPGWGLYIRSDLGDHYRPGSVFEWWFMYPNRILNGAIFIAHNIGIALVMNNPPERSEGTIFEKATYRPGQITIVKDERMKVIRLAWESPSRDERNITFGGATEIRQK